MRFRFTKKELEELSDARMLRALVAERKSNVTNYYSPLSTRLNKLYEKLDKQVQEEEKND